MNEWPLPNLVLVVNHASIHKVTGIHKLIEEHGARILYLPAYSPDFNPIKLTFSAIKGWLCTNWDHMNWEINAEDGMVYNFFGRLFTPSWQNKPRAGSSIAGTLLTSNFFYFLRRHCAWCGVEYLFCLIFDVIPPKIEAK